MAQRTEKEETEFKAVPENITLCVKCGVAGNHASATNNSCQKCLNATAEASAKPMKIGERSFGSSASARLNLPQTRGDLKKEPVLAVAAPPAKREVSRCSGCRKKVGLTGFRCRCGELFCADHRYSDRHDCSYDYKSAGREAIARDNPVVKAAKMVKI